MTADLESELRENLRQRESECLLRVRRPVSGRDGGRLHLGNDVRLDFCSNDYLGLADHPAIKAAAIAAIDKYGFGATASHLVCGHHREHAALEEELADFLGRPQALVFGSGYQANMAVQQCLLGRGAVSIQDKLNHASLLDGALAAGAKLQRYRHNDVGGLESRLAQSVEHPGLVAVDGVFSMDGDVAPLQQISQLCRRYNKPLLVDDAHGFGCLGEQGRGSFATAGIVDVTAVVSTFGKALGCVGAAVSGSNALIETLIQKARHYIYTTAMPPALAAAARAGITLLKEEGWRRQQLEANIAFFRRNANQLGLPLFDSPTAIQPLAVADNESLMSLAHRLEEEGFWLGAIRPPTVATPRLRISLSARHQTSDIEALLVALERHWPRGSLV